MSILSNLRLLCLLSLLGGVLHSCGPDNNGRGWRWLPNMVYPKGYEAYSENPLTEDGKTLLEPAEGSVHREQYFYPYPGTYEGLTMAMENPVKNPVAVSKETMARGKELYTRTCRTCHGEKGEGNGPITKGETGYPPVSLVASNVRDYPDGYIFHYITFSGGAVMPPYAAQVKPMDRFKIIHHLRTLQEEYANANPED